MSKDLLFKNKEKVKGKFNFNERTASVFDDMLRRSVPFYPEIQRMIVELAEAFVCSKSNVYDLGCSTGTTLVNLARHIDGSQINIIGIDSSEAMLKRARIKLNKNGQSSRCILLNADLNEDFVLNNASVVIMNLTLQFINPIKREFIVSKICNGLRRNGCFILVEKIKSNSAELNRKFTNFYYDLKLRNNYSKLEISRKRDALENVLIPYTYDKNARLLKKSGFKSTDCFFKWYNFCGIIAVKK